MVNTKRLQGDIFGDSQVLHGRAARPAVQVHDIEGAGGRLLEDHQVRKEDLRARTPAEDLRGGRGEACKEAGRNDHVFIDKDEQGEDCQVERGSVSRIEEHQQDSLGKSDERKTCQLI